MHIRTFNRHTFHSGYKGKSGGIHPFFEMLYIAQGTAVLEWMGGEYEVPSPSLYVLTPNTPHRLVRFQTPFSFWYIEMDIGDQEACPSAEQAIYWNRLQKEADYSSEELRPIKQTLDALSLSLEYKYRGSADYDDEIVKLDVMKTIRLIHNYLRNRLHASAEPNDKANREFIQTLMRHMETSYYEPIDLTALSNRVHLNSSYLVRAFKSETGITPMQYLNKLRLSAAISYLVNTEMGVQQIAEATGFNSIHYFSRLFKRKYGMSPQQWRLAQRK
ncbi:helix-turn-helix domain-containing protein [Paenibacillus mesophilus]|uniref:AraC family transcriptional regulator n=1 Tax=Paenibacillus mesophilus TaxID=2582849 RepID=UPI00110F003E|nr:AraC family transcriptional regulator [Paenibacillus mesophilus]TMV48960.1 helix-turn-helix domain-containing protein [Paenibacillus mesophilus]